MSVSVGLMDPYSEQAGSAIDQKFNELAFGTNLRGLDQKGDPFRRNHTIFKPNNQENLYPGNNEIIPCDFDTQCCNQPPQSKMSITGRLKDCYDPQFTESLTMWSYNTRLAPFAKRFTTSTVGFDTTEN
jgi:hypothetical protein